MADRTCQVNLADHHLMRRHGSLQQAADEGDALVVSEVDSDTVGEVAFTVGATLHELSPLAGSLEQAYLELTGQTAEFTSGGAR